MRQETTTRTLYQFDELSDKAKEKAREWWRAGQADDTFWTECVTDDAKECFRLIGFAVKDIYFSGFSSQGDGACFTGNWRASAVKPGKLQEHAPQDAELHRIAAEVQRIAAAFPDASACLTHRGNYCHEQSIAVDVELNPPEYDDGMARTQAEWAAIGKAAAPFEEDLIEAARDAMRWVYRTLEKEWEYQNADEQVDENIRAHEYEFTEEGKRA
jgi:hypothetical protein